MSRFVVYPLAAGIMALALSGCGQDCEGDANEKLAGAGKCDAKKGKDLCSCHLGRVDKVMEDSEDCKEDEKWSEIKNTEQSSSKKQCCETPATEAQKQLDDANKEQGCKLEMGASECCDKLVEIRGQLHGVFDLFKDGCGDKSSAELNIEKEACDKMKVLNDGGFCDTDFEDTEGRCPCKKIIAFEKCSNLAEVVV